MTVSSNKGRRETFLALYPRWFKLAVSLLILTAFVTPQVMQWLSWHQELKEKALHLRAHHVESPSMPFVGEDAKDQVQGPAEPKALPSDMNATNVPGAVLNQPNDTSIKLEPAPFADLNEVTPDGNLPSISESGRQPWQAYARPFNQADRRPRIAIIIADMGLLRDATETAINNTPLNVTLSFNPTGPASSSWCARARQVGHETLLQIPMEPFDYPQSDPGSSTLLTSNSSQENLARLRTGLRQCSGYVGITTISGSRFSTDPTHLAPVLDELLSRGLMFFDARVAPHSVINDLAHQRGVPTAASTLRIDRDLSPESIDAALASLEAAARQKGYAIGLTAPYPVVMAHIRPWADALASHGFVLAPVSAVVN